MLVWACTRQRIREQDGIAGDYCSDCLTMTLCPCCALIQELNHVDIRNREKVREWMLQVTFGRWPHHHYWFCQHRSLFNVPRFISCIEPAAIWWSSIGSDHCSTSDAATADGDGNCPNDGADGPARTSLRRRSNSNVSGSLRSAAATAALRRRVPAARIPNAASVCATDGQPLSGKRVLTN